MEMPDHSEGETERRWRLNQDANSRAGITGLRTVWSHRAPRSEGCVQTWLNILLSLSRQPFPTRGSAFSFCTGPHILRTWPYRQLSLLFAQCLGIKCLNPTGKVHKDGTPPLLCSCLHVVRSCWVMRRRSVSDWHYCLLPSHNLAFSLPRAASVKRRDDSGKRMTPCSDCLMLTHSFNNRY